MKDLEVGKFYCVRFYRDNAPWQPARRVSTDYGDGWEVLGIEPDMYDTEVNEVGPEIIPPQ